MLKDYSIIKPKTRSFISFNAHSKGLKNKINLNIKFIRKYFLNYNLRQYKNILVLGSSTGYGLSTSLTAYFSLKPFNIINVFFDRKSKGTKTASSGWYNMSHLSSKVNNNRTSVFFLNEDVFLNKTKRKVLKLLGILNIKLDLLVYSIAAPKRLDIRKNSSLSACLKPVIAKYEGKTINLDSGDVVSCILQIADFKEIYSTKYVMGGEDWFLWVNYLTSYGYLNNSFQTFAYSYVGPELTWSIYKYGTIGEAKKDLFLHSRKIFKLLSKSLQCKVFVFLNKAVTTQASAAIPVVPLYLSILYRCTGLLSMNEQCLGQIARVFHKLPLFKKKFGVLRLDEYEIEGNTQLKLFYSWVSISKHSINTLGSFNSYRKSFLKLFGFCFNNIDYTSPININATIVNKLY